MNDPGPSKLVVVGHFNGPWGVQGWVRVFSHTRPQVAIFDYQPWRFGESDEEMVVEEWRQAGPRLVAKLRGIDSPEAASALGRGEIRISRSSLPDSGAGHYYWRDLIGLEVVNLDDYCYGRVMALIETGAHDVLDVRGDRHDSVLIPFVVDEFIRRVDLHAGRIVVDWPLEWLEDDA